MAKATAAPKKALNKSQLLAAIAETSELSKKEVTAVLEALGAEEIKKSLSSKGPGVIQIPGLIKIAKQKVPAKPARTGPDPFNKGQMRDYPAKPATTKVKVRALKMLKEWVK